MIPKLLIPQALSKENEADISDSDLNKETVSCPSWELSINRTATHSLGISLQVFLTSVCVCSMDLFSI